MRDQTSERLAAVLASLEAIDPDSFDVAEGTTGADAAALLTLARFVVAKMAGADKPLPPPPWATSKTRDAATPAIPPDGVDDAIRYCCDLLTALREQACSRSDWPGSDLCRAVGAAESLVVLAYAAFRFENQWAVTRLPEPSPGPAAVDRRGQPSAQLRSTVFYLTAMHTRAKVLLELGFLVEAKETCARVFAEYRTLVQQLPDMELRQEYLVVVLRLCEVLIKQGREQEALAVLSDLIHRCWRHPELDSIARRAVELQDEMTFNPDCFLDEIDLLENQLDVEFLIGVAHDIWDAYDRGTDLDYELVRTGMASPDENTDAEDTDGPVDPDTETLSRGQLLGMLDHYLGARVVSRDPEFGQR
ncbi:hypothetical protein C5U48_02715 [Mycolicibacter virginiensis]|uniref:Uncharacterized protein n=1 Tax=Mycolicibacter virginiensis TaxID=1795032 RepID=A0A9X7P033_9MYCO|nr:hypothetical protein [Mycolicibacter virginiensis]PQM53738.1 hypothetical protein C5U48_02715 [Mycolicibacter virginiensis]